LERGLSMLDTVVSTTSFALSVSQLLTIFRISSLLRGGPSLSRAAVCCLLCC